ncbi:MAG: type I pullulanase [Blautia sp.]|nr:type I pullulanase [Lachnoclostridium sp.]MCM1212279.1 type I pullulanase [Blautia sp.]
MRKAKSRAFRRIMAAVLSLVMVLANVQTVPGLALTALAAESGPEISGSEENGKIADSNTTEPGTLTPENGGADTGTPEGSGANTGTPEGSGADTGTPGTPEGGGADTGMPEGSGMDTGTPGTSGEDGITEPETPGKTTDGEAEPAEPEKSENSTTDAAGTATVKIHFKNTAGWDEVCAHYWNPEDPSQTTAWPGIKLSPDADNPANYTLVVENRDVSSGFACIFNNNNNGAQTADLKFSADLFTDTTFERWVIWGGAQGSEVIIKEAPKAWNVSITSPEVNDRQVTFRFYSPVFVTGEMNGWSTTAWEMTEGGDGIYSYTATTEPRLLGKYQYKFFSEGNYFLDPSNPRTEPDDSGSPNSLLIVPGLKDQEIEVQKGVETTLPDALPRLMEDGETEEDVAISGYALKDNTIQGITLVDGKITIPDSYAGTSLELTATTGAEGKTETATVTLKIVDKVLTSPEVDGTSVTFRYQDADAASVSLLCSADENSPVAMTKDPEAGENVFTCTVTWKPGKYLYQFSVVKSGKTTVIRDPKNIHTQDGKSVVCVAGLVAPKCNVASKKTTTLPKLTFLSENGTETAVENAVYTVKDENDKVSLDADGKKIIVGDYTGKIVLTATATVDGEEYKSDITINAVEDTNKITVKLHYERTDGDYTGWNIWGWRVGASGVQYDFADENGEKVATIELEDARANHALNYIIRKSTASNEWDKQTADLQIDLSDVLCGTVHFYAKNLESGGTRELGDDALTGVKIISAAYDSNNGHIIVKTGLPMEEEVNGAFTLKASGKEMAIQSVTDQGTNTYEIVAVDDMTSIEAKSKTYYIVYDGYDYKVSMPSVYSTEEFENLYTYDGSDLGATWTAEKTTFKVWAPTADKVQVYLYTSGTAGIDDRIAELDMVQGDRGVWSAEKTGDLNGTYYTYCVTTGETSVEACDPYARTTGVNGNRAMVVNLDATNPDGWAEDISPNQGMGHTDSIIYEMHIRDFSIDASSGVTTANRGKFLGVTETGTHNATGQTTGLDYLVDLGVTHVHLLPSYDYGSVDETALNTPQYNWGYDPVNYNVPEGSYSTDPYKGEVRVKEMKQMVKTLHDNGINVVMDVVYNHVYDADTFCFNQIVPQYFSRVNPDGSYSNGSGCGNDTASERSMVKKYIVDSVNYWADEYHIDGFRFDLVGLLDTETINEVVSTVRAKHPNAIFYGEGWKMDTGVTKEGYTMATQANSAQTSGFAYFSDTMRDLLKGGNDETSLGFVSGATGREDDIKKSFMATPPWSSNPTQIVNYASCHDNYTLKDKLDVSKKTSSEEDRIKMNNLAAAIYMTAQGMPLIHAGEELLRTKVDETGTIIHNSYNSPDYVNSIKWDGLNDSSKRNVHDYYKGLIAFRKKHAALRLDSAADVAANVSYKKIANQVVMFVMKGRESVPDETADGIVVIFNASESAKEINLYNAGYGISEGSWKVCINGEKAGVTPLETITDGKVTVGPISAMVLVEEADKSELNELIAEADEILEKGKGAYTDESWTAFTAALTSAKGVAEDKAAKQPQVDSAVEALQEAIDNLADYSSVGYFVTFDYRCTDIEPKRIDVLSGALISEAVMLEVNKVTRPGYTLQSTWYRDEACTKAWNFDTDTVQGDITLYGVWSRSLSASGGDAAEETPLYMNDIQPLVYTGSALKPAVIVYAEVVDETGKTKQIQLKSGKDYKVTYKNNTNASVTPDTGDKLAVLEKQYTNKDTKPKNLWSERPYVEIKAQGAYSGYIYQEFTILPADINDAALKYASQAEEKKKTKVVTSLKYKKALKEGTDFEVEVCKDGESTPVARTESKVTGSKTTYTAASIPADKAAAGSYTLTLTGKGNYKGTIKIEGGIIIAKKAQLMKNVSVSLGKNIKSRTWTGTAIKLQSAYAVKGNNATLIDDSTASKNDVYTVKIGKTFLRENIDFKVKYRDNTGIGTATMILTGLENKQDNMSHYCTGTKEVTFKITGVKLASSGRKANIAIKEGTSDGLKDEIYTGLPITKENLTLECIGDNGKHKNGEKLALGKDYTVSYKNNIKKGTATVTITPTVRSGYTGKLTARFKITQAELPAAVTSMTGAEKSSTAGASGAWTATAAVPFSPAGAKLTGITPVNKDGIALKEKADYTIVYDKKTDYKKAGNVSVILRGKGNYKGDLTVNFTIGKASIENLSVTAKALQYQPNKTDDTYAYTPAVTVKNGKTTLKGSGNSPQYTVSYNNNKPSDVEKYIKKESGAKAPTATVTLNPDDNYQESQIEIPLNIWNVKLTASNVRVEFAQQDHYYEGGLQIRPAYVKIWYDPTTDKKKFAEGTKDTWIDLSANAADNYDIVWGANNKTGKTAGTMKITGKGVYSGTVTVKFEIQKKRLDKKVVQQLISLPNPASYAYIRSRLSGLE